MKNILTISFIFLAVVLVLTPAHAQTAMTKTTLAAAVTTTSANTVQLASSTNVLPNGFLYVDGELMQITGQYVAGNTIVNVRRGATPGMTKARTHVSGAVVYVTAPGAQSTDGFRAFSPVGSCTSTNEIILPVWNTLTGDQFDCRSSGQWIRIQSGGTMGGWTGAAVRGFCTGTAGSAETEFLNGAACSGATTATARQVISAPGTLANLRVYSSANAVGGTGKDVLTVYKNGSATTVTCTIAAAAATCSDTSHSVAVVAGDVITFQFVTATSDTAANVSASVEKY